MIKPRNKVDTTPFRLDHEEYAKVMQWIDLASYHFSRGANSCREMLKIENLTRHQKNLDYYINAKSAMEYLANLIRTK